MQFFKPEAFQYLWAVPFLGILAWFSHRLWMQKVEQMGNQQTFRHKLMPRYRIAEWGIRTFYLSLVFIFATIALAQPQWGEEKKTVQRKGIDMIFLLDTSLSMLAEDIKPNRFQKSKLEIKSFIRRLEGDRVGIVAFAGSGFLQAPLTLDYAAFLLFLDSVDVGYIPDPGTSLDQAIRLASRSFPDDSLKHKAIVVFSDGEDHEGNIEAALKEASRQNVRVYTIGVGTIKGDPIPLKDDRGNRSGFKKDRQGEIVITKLNEELLQKIANETGAVYLPSTPSEREIDLILKHMESLGQRQFKERLVLEKEDHYQLFLFLAFLFLGFEMLVRRSVKTASQSLVILFVFLMFSGFLKGPKQLTDDGNDNYAQKRYQSALEQYREAQVKAPEDPTIRYNLATTLYQVREFQEARKEFEQAIKLADNDDLRSKALYNYGNTQYRLGNFDQAIDSYQKSLEINPDDEDAKYNLEFLMKQKSLFEKKDQDRKQSQQEQQQKQQQQQQQQQKQQQQQQQEQKQDEQQQQQDQEDKTDQTQQGEEKKEDQKSPGQKEQEEQEKDREEKQDQGQAGEGQQEQKEEPEPQDGDVQGRLDQDQQEEKEEPKEEQEEMPPAKPLQGQMTMENALQLLDAMNEAEKDLQDLRRPPSNREQPPPLKDW